MYSPSLFEPLLTTLSLLMRGQAEAANEAEETEKKAEEEEEKRGGGRRREPSIALVGYRSRGMDENHERFFQLLPRFGFEYETVPGKD